MHRQCKELEHSTFRHSTVKLLWLLLFSQSIWVQDHQHFPPHPVDTEEQATQSDSFFFISSLLFAILCSYYRID